MAELQNPDAITVSAKYIYLDVVSFTQGRSVEAQSEIVSVLNDLVSASLKDESVAPEKLILLPTGDGLCICFVEVEIPYDIHIRVARKIIERLDAYNTNCQDEMRKFDLRIGINANVDNLVTDINGKQNIAGAGINIAARVMAAADKNQILVGQVVYNTLSQREKYMQAFKPFQAVAKHNVNVPVFQLIDPNCVGLNNNIPSAFVQPNERLKLSRKAAYFIAYAIKYKDIIMAAQKAADSPMYTQFAAIVLLTVLAQDAIEAKQASEHYSPTYWAYNAGNADFSEQLAYYEKQDFNVNTEYAEFFYRLYLQQFPLYFVNRFELMCYITPKGANNLKIDWPSIYSEFEFVYFPISEK